METPPARNLDWDGCFNVRDLGGLATADGRRTRWGAIVRGDSLGALSARGWEQLQAHGVRTVIDLRNEDEWGEDAAPRPATIETLRIPLDETDDREFWDDWENGPQFATPLYYGPHLHRFPAKSAEVVAAIARADPGGVAFHCAGGRDRSGQIAILVLALAGVVEEEIVADYLLSHERLPALYEARGEEDQTPLLQAFLRERGTSAATEIRRLLESDLEAVLSQGGLRSGDVAALRARLLDSPWNKDGRAWRIGSDAEVSWIQEGTEGGLAITSAIPPLYEAYATLELPGTGNHDPRSALEDPSALATHDRAVLTVLTEHTSPQPWWLGYLQTGSTDVVFDEAPRLELYAHWPYVLIEAGPEQAGAWRDDGRWKGVLSDLVFPADRSWLLSTLWDDDWTCIGGSRRLVDALLAHPDLRQRAHEVDPSDEDVTPPGHTAF